MKLTGYFAEQEDAHQRKQRPVEVAKQLGVEANPAKSLTIRLLLPPAAVSPNARCHWASKMNATANQRRDAATAARAALGRSKPPYWKRAMIHATFHKPSKRAKVADADNLIASLKACVDGIADAGILSNDRGLTWLPVEQVLQGSEPAGVVVVITPY